MVKTGSLFFALSGTKQHGNAFITEAITRGAAAIVTDVSPATQDRTVSFVVVSDVNAALSSITKSFFGNPSARLKTLGVTGTNGKTTIAWVLSEALQLMRRPTCYVGTLGYRNLQNGFVKDSSTTTPSLIDFTQFLFDACASGIQSVACEASSHGLDQRRLLGVEWDMAIFTNLTRDHLDYHETFENYQQAKLKLFTEGLAQSPKKNKCAILNLDDPFTAEIVRALQPIPEIRVITYSATRHAADVHVTSWYGNATETVLEASIFGEPVTVRSKLVGAYNVHNLLAVLGTLRMLDVTMADIVSAIASVSCVPGRLELVENPRVPIFIDYAHTPDGLLSVQRSLRPLTKARLITVFGCGGDRDRGKRPLMGEAVAELSDYAVVTSDNPRSEKPEDIIAQIIPGMQRVSRPERFQWDVVPDRARAIRVAIGKSKPGDVVLIAGKGHETYQEIRGVRHPFSDREQCIAALRELNCVNCR